MSEMRIALEPCNVRKTTEFSSAFEAPETRTMTLLLAEGTQFLKVHLNMWKVDGPPKEIKPECVRLRIDINVQYEILSDPKTANGAGHSSFANARSRIEIGPDRV
jgi:hypothetical protein